MKIKKNICDSGRKTDFCFVALAFVVCLFVHYSKMKIMCIFIHSPMQ